MIAKPSTLSIDAEGFDVEARSIIAIREPVIARFLCETLGVAIDEYDAKVDPLERLNSKAFIAYEAEQVEPPGDAVSYENAKAKWRNEVLFPLAKELGLLERTYKIITLNCIKHRCFDCQHSNRHIRPELDDILPKLLDVFHTADTNERRAALLIERRLCPDRERALVVVNAFKGSALRDTAGRSARQILLNVLHYGRVGLLANSDYPHTSTLFRLESFASYIQRISTTPAVTIALVRADLISLQVVLLQHKHEKHSLWQENLLHWKPEDSNRKRFLKEYITPRRRAFITNDIAAVRDLEINEATRLITTFFEQGLAAIIDWRIGVATESTDFFIEEQRIQRVINHHLSCLDSERVEVARLMLTHLRDAARAVGVPISFHRLLSEKPNNEYRRKRKAALGFHFNKRLTEQGRALRDEFQRRTGHPEGMARRLLADFYSYGGVGLIPPAQRAEAVSHPAREVLHFFKLARPQETAEWADIVQSVNLHLESLALTKLTPQVGRAVYFELDKPRRWHCGSGGATERWARVNWQDENTPRLNRAWYAIGVSFPLNLIDDAYHPIGDTCYVVLVLDADSELPVGLWASATPLGERELALALYQSIWHPGKPNWQIRGLPATVYLPASVQLAQANSLAVASQHLLLDLSSYENERYWRQKALVKQLRAEGADVAYRRAPKRRATLQQTQDRLLHWIHNLAFANGRSARHPRGLGSAKLAMPAYTWAAAGLLLPTGEQLTTVRNGVIRASTVYTSSYASIPPGQPARVREYVYRYTADDPGFFIEVGAALYYLTPTMNERVTP